MAVIGTDAFTGTNGDDLPVYSSANWIDPTWTNSFPLEIQSNRATGTGSAENQNVWNATINADHYAAVVLYDGSASNYSGICVRCDSSDGGKDLYQASTYPGEGTIYLEKFVADTWSSIANISYTASGGEELKLEIQSNTLKVYIDDVQKGTNYSDSDHAGNTEAGIAGFGAGGNAGDDFEIGDFTAAGGGQPMMLRATTVPAMRQWAPRNIMAAMRDWLRRLLKGLMYETST